MERPKQRRHRCKDPTKLDINSLTGEERVPVVHRGTGRRVKNTHSCTSLLIKFNRGEKKCPLIIQASIKLRKQENSQL